MGKSTVNTGLYLSNLCKLKLVNKNGSKNGEHVTVINENHIERRPMCIHGPTLLFEKTFDNNCTQPIQFYACSAFRNPKECPILSDDQVVLNRTRLQAHSKSILGLAEVNKVIVTFYYSTHNEQCNIYLRLPNSRQRNVLIVIRVPPYSLRSERIFIKITTS